MMRWHSPECRLVGDEEGSTPRSAASSCMKKAIGSRPTCSPGDHSMSATLMSGFPSAEAGQVTLANWRAAPYMKWAFQHVREIVPSADIPNAPDDVWKLESAPLDFSSFRFERTGKPYGLDKFINETDTDGLVVLHKGKVVLARYGNGMPAT